jgi:tRNA A-37 threonylcarbamoyl transferase component Bud32
MDAARYNRIRELFLKVEELPRDQQTTYLHAQAGDDQDLIDEVVSLLREHDPDAARIEGEKATPVRPPMTNAAFTNVPGIGGSVDRSGTQDALADQDTGKVTSSGDGNGSGRGVRAGGQISLSDQDREQRTLDSTITQRGAQRTHAAPRYDLDSTKRQEPDSSFWDRRTRRNQRLNSGWLWLAALLPTALIGSLTYWQVASSQREAKRNELSGLADSVLLSTQGFLNERARLVESWSRQAAIRQSILELVEIAKRDEPSDALKKAAQADLIRLQLQELSGFNDVKFVVWDRTGTTLASWLPDRLDVGSLIHPNAAANLSRVMRGERVLYGPRRLTNEDAGFDPDKSEIVMAHLVPVRNEKDSVVAALLVRGISTFEDFDEMFREISQTSGLDVYAVDRRGDMITNSTRAVTAAGRVELELSPNEIVANLRVSDPGFLIRPNNVGTVQRNSLPLTQSVASAISGKSDVRVEVYNNYAGVPTVGAWSWNRDWQVGVLVEHDATTAFAPARIVRLSFLILGTLLSVTAYLAAKQIAKRTSRAHAAVHPLSRYELLNELGSGGMGVVYHARHRQLGRETALKVLRNDRQSTEDRLRFDREARLAASLSNPHSVMIYDYGRSEEGEAFCVMEFLRGITLYEVVARSGYQEVSRVLLILRQICDALAEAHNMELLHRDIKPQNVMLSLDASVGDWAVVFDFGLAKPLQSEKGAFQTAETVWAGTPMYMAPERYREPGGMDPRSDIYSVGCIAYFLLTGRPPYMECDPETLFALVLSESPIAMETHRGEPLPQAIVDLVDRCMAKKPEDRFARVEDLSAAVDRLLTEYPWTTQDAREWWGLHGEA